MNRAFLAILKSVLNIEIYICLIKIRFNQLFLKLIFRTTNNAAYKNIIAY